MTRAKAAITHIDTDVNMFVLDVPRGSLSAHRLNRLPYAVQSGQQWQVAVCRDAVAELQSMVRGGLVEDPFNVVGALSAEEFSFAREGRIMRPSRGGAAAVVWKKNRTDSSLDSRIGSGMYVKGQEGAKLRVPRSALGTLAVLVAEGTLVDPDRVVRCVSDNVVCFDARYGQFVVVGDSEVSAVFEEQFPQSDIVADLRAQGVSIDFSDEFSEEVYRGAVAFRGEGIQPDGITVDLFPYQRQSVAMIVERTGTGVFLAPGLGKTLVAVAAGQELLSRGLIDRVVVVPPGAVARQWSREIARFTGGSVDDVVVVLGSKPKREQLYADGLGARWVVVHHDLLSRDAEFVSRLVDSRTLLVVDESHKGNNYTTARHKAMVKLARAAGRRVIMTGTPVLNNAFDWYNTMSRFVEPDLFGFNHFSERYLYQDSYGGHNGARNLDDLAERSALHFVRYRKEDVAHHLAPLQVSNVPVEVDKQYKKALVKVHTAAAAELTKHFVRIEDSEAVGNMTAYGMLRALCSSPRLVLESDSAGAKTLSRKLDIPDVDGPKVELLMDIASKFQASGERIVVFTYSRTMVELLEKRFTEAGIRFVSYHGGTNDSDRDKAVQAFTGVSGKGDDPTVFLATDAAAEGLNLGKECCTLINLDLPWTAGRLEQRYNRIHRVDGTHPSYVAVNLTLVGTVEDSILRKIETKASIADVLFGERTAFDITGHMLAQGDTSVKEALVEHEKLQ